MQKSLHDPQILRAIFSLDVNSMAGFSGSLNLWPKQLKPDFPEFVVNHQKLDLQFTRFARFAVYHFPFPRCQGFKKVCKLLSLFALFAAMADFQPVAAGRPPLSP